jgi:hypothetical protein
MPAAEFCPFRTEEPAHDAGAQLYMRLPLATFHRTLPKVSGVVKQEREPQARIARETVQPAPSDGEKRSVNNEIVNTE